MALAPIAERFTTVVPYQVVRLNSLTVRANVPIVVDVALSEGHFIGCCVIGLPVGRQSHDAASSEGGYMA
jgi:hypothetical protein